MAVFLLNVCKFNECGIQFPNLTDLIHHIEATHIGEQKGIQVGVLRVPQKPKMAIKITHPYTDNLSVQAWTQSLIESYPLVNSCPPCDNKMWGSVMDHLPAIIRPASGSKSINYPSIGIESPAHQNTRVRGRRQV